MKKYIYGLFNIKILCDVFPNHLSLRLHICDSMTVINLTFQ